MANPIILIIAAIAAAAYLIYQNWEPIKKFFIDMWDGIVNFMSPLIQKFKDIGGQIIQGLVDGIKAMAMAPINAVTEIADGIAAKFKNTLGIKSPSRVFVEFGRNVALGAAVGMQAATPVAAAASQTLSSTVVNQGAAPTTINRVNASSRNNAPVTITYSPTLNFNGGTPEAKADMLREFEKHSRELARIVNDQNRLEGRKSF